MRFAGVMVLVAGCASQEPTTIDLVVGPNGAQYFISPPGGCTCHAIEMFPGPGSCSESSDVGPSCSCDLVPCMTSIDVVRDGDVIASTPRGEFPRGGVAADLTAPGAAIRLRGCDVLLPLATAFPAAPVYTISTETRQATWDAIPNDGFLAETSGGFGGELCRTEPGATSVQMHVGFHSIDIHTLHGPFTLQAPFTQKSPDLVVRRWETN